jgi:broad specificity phosphatase PhoE
LFRATQTAEILSNALNVPYQITDALREYDCGILEGRSDEQGWQLYNAVLQAWVNGDWTQRIEQGESFLDIQHRFVPFIEQLGQRYGPAASNIMLIGHGGTYRCMLPLVLTNIDFNFTLSHAIPHTTPIIAELQPEGLVCLNWGDLVISSAS